MPVVHTETNLITMLKVATSSKETPSRFGWSNVFELVNSWRFRISLFSHIQRGWPDIEALQYNGQF